MEELILNVTFTPFASGYCFTSYNQFGNDVANALIVTFPGNYTAWNFGPNQPGNSDRSRPWLVTDGADNAPLGVATWSPTYGKWIAPHPTPPSGDLRVLWVGSLTSLETYDGGEAGTVTDTTGPFWEADTAFDDKFPLGVGATITTVATNDDVFDDATPGAPQARSVYFLKRTTRIYRVFS